MSRILIIDDNELLGKMLAETLTEEGFETAVALDANSGYSNAIDFHPDLILLDVQLPDIAGSDLIGLIKNRDDLQHIPIIMITGTHNQTEHKVKAFQAGADDYVLKPFEMPELLERIKAVLRRSIPQKEFQMPSEREPDSHPLVPSETNTTAPLPPAVPEPEILTLKETFYRALVCPDALAGVTYPPITLVYLSTLLGLALGGWALSAGSTVKPALIGLGTAGFWGLCVAFLVMSCSIMGISLTWKDGARMICLAGLPLLLKAFGGFVTALVTSLTPFYYTASPAIFFKSAPVWLERFDVFECWMVWLIWVLVKECRGATKEKAWAAAAVVWPVIAYWQSLWKH